MINNWQFCYNLLEIFAIVDIKTDHFQNAFDSSTFLIYLLFTSKQHCFKPCFFEKNANIQQKESSHPPGQKVLNSKKVNALGGRGGLNLTQNSFRRSYLWKKLSGLTFDTQLCLSNTFLSFFKKKDHAQIEK